MNEWVSCFELIVESDILMEDGSLAVVETIFIEVDESGGLRQIAIIIRKSNK